MSGSGYESRMPRLPVSVRLTLWYGLWQLGMLVLFAFVVAAAIHFDRHMQIHQRLFSAQADLMTQISAGEAGLQADPSLGTLDGVYAREDPLAMHVRLLAADGSVIDASPNVTDRPFIAPDPPAGDGIVELDRRVERQLLRVMYAPVPSPDGDAAAGWLEVSVYNLDTHQLLPARLLLLVIPLFVVVSLIGGYILARRALRPVADLTDTARRIQPGEMHLRLDRPTGFRDELTDLTDTFNGMLERLEEAFERERRFTENAAHEMMNPVTALRSEAETVLRRARSPEEYRESFRSILSESIRLGSVLELLLHLAHVESDAAARTQSADLSAVVRRSLDQWRGAADAREIDMKQDSELPMDAVVPGTAAYLEMIVDNLIDNALKYTPVGGSVRVSLGEAEGVWQMSVQDTGIGFDPDEANTLFNRFYRSEVPGVREQPGSGLGLTLVRAVVSVLGGSVTAESPGTGRGSTFMVTLPALHPS